MVAWNKKYFLGSAVTVSIVFQVLFRVDGHRVSARFHLFVSDINRGKEEVR